ncbi:hypothetical protein L950_0223335 [Sphingobacterium sp. IITKGP-BTPF85]|nr:hypothetical protein L950_0223335 [Sphingobacterium sp. IITKGP-BTPF85]
MLLEVIKGKALALDQKQFDYISQEAEKNSKITTSKMKVIGLNSIKITFKTVYAPIVYFCKIENGQVLPIFHFMHSQN